VLTYGRDVSVPSAQNLSWIETHGRLKAEFGRYSLYELPDALPRTPLLLRVPTNYEHTLSHDLVRTAARVGRARHRTGASAAKR